MEKLLVLVVVVFLAAPVSALTYIGPPCSELRQGQVSLGFEYSTAETDVELDAFGLTETLEEVETDLMMGRFALGLGSASEFFGRLGLGEIEDLGREFAWGAGVKVGSADKGPLRIGVAAQVTNVRGDEMVAIPGLVFEGDIDVYEIQVVAGPLYEIGPLSLYGGPMLHFITGEIDALGVSVDLEQESEFGGYVGLAWNMDESTSLAVEYQSTGDADAIGVGLLHRFGGTAPTARQRETSLPRLKSGQEPAGYRGYIDPRTGEIQVEPVGPKARMKVDEKGEPVKDKDGNFIFEPVEPEK